MAESEPLLPTTTEQTGLVQEDIPRHKRWQAACGEAMESKRAHGIIIALIVVDAICVITDLSWVFLSCSKGEDELPDWLEALSRLSLAINILFLIEIPLSIWAYGWQFYSPFHDEYPHSGFHLFDASIILGNIVIDVFLRGKAEKLASLIVIFRLWRIVKVVGGVAVGVSEWNEEAAKELKASHDIIKGLKERIDQLETENAKLSGSNGDS